MLAYALPSACELALLLPEEEEDLPNPPALPDDERGT
jgi:hypothetical protein